jgi:hypothetical protein
MIPGSDSHSKNYSVTTVEGLHLAGTRFHGPIFDLLVKLTNLSTLNVQQTPPATMRIDSRLSHLLL